jgi:hypothetical protein
MQGDWGALRGSEEAQSAAGCYTLDWKGESSCMQHMFIRAQVMTELRATISVSCWAAVVSITFIPYTSYAGCRYAE